MTLPIMVMIFSENVFFLKLLLSSPILLKHRLPSQSVCQYNIIIFETATRLVTAAPCPQSSPSVTLPLLSQDAVANSPHSQQFSAVRQMTRDLQQRKPRDPKRTRKMIYIYSCIWSYSPHAFIECLDLNYVSWI